MRSLPFINYVTLLIVPLFFGCAAIARDSNNLASGIGKSKVKVEYDEFENQTTYEQNILLQSEKFTPGSHVNLALKQIIDHDTGGVTYYLVPQWQGDYWLFVSADDAIIFLADGVRYDFRSGSDSARIAGYGGRVTEFQLISLDDLITLSEIFSASKVKVRWGHQDRLVSDVSIAKFLHFIRDCIERE